MLGGALTTAEDYPAAITTYNDAVQPGFWITGSWSDAPSADSGCMFVLKRNTVVYQLWFAASNNQAFYRRKDITETWKAWVKFIGL